MTINANRRTVARGALWTVPVVAVAAAAPAFAVSQRCRPTGRCKNPGNPKDKSYVVVTNCGLYDRDITAVTVDKIAAEPLEENGVQVPGQWIVPDFKDSRSQRDVTITYSDSTTEEYFNVQFLPC